MSTNYVLSRCRMEILTRQDTMVFVILSLHFSLPHAAHENDSLSNCRHAAVIARSQVTELPPEHASRHHVQDSIDREC